MELDKDYEVIAADEDEFSRRELREFPDRYVAVSLRRAVGGGWYARDQLVVKK